MKARKKVDNLSRWLAGEELPPLGSSRERATHREEALRQFAKIVGWDNSVRDAMLPKVRTGIERVCSNTRRYLSNQDSSLPPKVVDANIRQISTHLANAVALMRDDRKATVKIMSWLDAPDAPKGMNQEFAMVWGALLQLDLAARNAALNPGAVVGTLDGVLSSNIAKLYFLKECRDLISVFSGQKVSLYKGPSKLLRFARPLWRYATGQQVADGSFDRQIEELRRIAALLPLAASETKNGTTSRRSL